MRDDWQVGDLALCVRRHSKYPPDVRPGAIFSVEAVWGGCKNAENRSHIDVALDLVGVPRMDGEIAYWAGSFRKIRPHTPDREDAETIRLLTGAPARETTDA